MLLSSTGVSGSAAGAATDCAPFTVDGIFSPELRGDAITVDSAGRVLTVGGDAVVALDDFGTPAVLIPPEAGVPSLRSVSGVAVDPTDRVHVTTTDPPSVRRFGADGTQGLSITALDATPALEDPTAVDVDAAGNIYVTDILTDTVHRFDPSGNQTLAIDLSSSVPPQDFATDVAVDGAGNIHVIGVGSIHRFDSTGTQTLHIAASVPTPALTSAAAKLAVDGGGNIWVVDGDESTIHRFSPAGVPSLTIPPGAASPALVDPTGIAVDPATGNVVVGTIFNFFQAFDSGGGHLGTLFPNRLDLPTDVDVEVGGRGAVLDPVRERVFRFDSDGRQTGYTENLGTGNAVATNESGEVLVVRHRPGDHDDVHRLDANGLTTGFLDGSRANPDLTDILGLGSDIAGRVYVADRSGNVFRFEGDTQTLRIPAQAAAPPLEVPRDVDADDAGNIYVADSVTRHVYRFDDRGDMTLAIDQTGRGANAVAVSPNGSQIAVAENGGRVAVYDADGDLIEREDLGVPVAGIALDEDDGLYFTSFIARQYARTCLDGVSAPAFTDVPAWAADAIAWLTDPAHDPVYATGYSDQTFRPDQSVSRGQIAFWLYNLAGAPDVADLPPHGLVDVDPW
ncbi:MAG: S-layer homology domain-containing protein, partial [Actinomycetota bacterium]